MNIKGSLRLAGDHLLAILDPERNGLPYWQVTVGPDYRAEMKNWWPAHNLGRWWDAILRLEAAIGFEIPGPVEAAMRENTRRFFDNPDAICLNPEPDPLHPHADREAPLWDLHSLREGLLALNALARWRNDGRAAETGGRMVRSVADKLRDDGSWDLGRFDAFRNRGKDVIHNLDPCDTHGRMLEALVWFYETTGDLEAFRLADRLAEYHFAHTLSPGGEVPDTARADHTHSYLGTLRGLLLYGRLTRRREFVEGVERAYRANVPRVVHESGYTSHNMAEESFGETTSPGDAAQLALWLALSGQADRLDDAERLARARLLPSQILDTPPLIVQEDGRDCHRDVGRRILGAYGGCHFHPHGGKTAVTDVTAAGVHSLVDLYLHTAVTGDAGLEVFFHFDYEDDRVRVRSRRDARAELSVTPKTDGPLAIRVPRWTPPESVVLKVGGERVMPVFAGAFARTGRVDAGDTVTLEYALPERRSRETGLGAEYDLLWRGDEVAGVRPNTNFYPFYPDIPL
jgi:hypothetical protein